MGVSIDWPRSSSDTCSKTHFSTRLFSPYPGHSHAPSADLRNQLTKKIFGSFAASAFAPTASQWAQ